MLPKMKVQPLAELVDWWAGIEPHWILPAAVCTCNADTVCARDYWLQVILMTHIGRSCYPCDFVLPWLLLVCLSALPILQHNTRCCTHWHNANLAFAWLDDTGAVWSN